MTNRISRVRRAMMYVPGNGERKILKGAASGADAVILDLEDGVAFTQKDEARDVILRALKDIDFGRSERMVRINPLFSGRAAEDLRAVMQGRPDAILIPKVDSAEIVFSVAAMISAEEQTNQIENGVTALVLTIESGLAFINLPAICQASGRIQALVFGCEDFCTDLGITRSPDSREVFFARSSLVMHAAAYGLQAIDMVHTNYLNLAELEKECCEGRGMGFSGKQVIHPAQIETVQRIFVPDENAIEHARQVVEGAEQAQHEGKGAFTLDGQMVDLPVVKRAETILARARAAGLLD